MDNKYKKLTFKEKIELRKKYKKTKKGFGLNPILNRLIIWGLLSWGCSVSFIYVIFTSSPGKWLKICLWILSGFMFVVGLIFLIWQQKIRIREYNNYLEKSDDSSKVRKRKK